MNNYISKFAPNSYFFTDPGAFTQSPGQSFGPVDADNYRLTAKFTMNSAAMAYAICTGIALVQPQTGSSTKVNLILRPFKQPIVGLNIKYFIYRGLNKSDFFTGNNLAAAGSGQSDFVNKANTDFSDFYLHKYPGQPVPEFQAKFIGFDPAGQADNLIIDSLFFKQAITTETDGNVTEDPSGAFELPLAQIGSTLGRFATGECGMDVVISYGDYQLPQPNDEFVFDLAYARAAQALIDLSTETSEFKKKQTKEQIFQFLDIAAYYGFHSNDLGWVKTKQGSDDITKKGSDIYTALLQNFHSKNTLYLYIQSDRTRSYNFYGNYTIGEGPNCLKLGRTETALAEQNYGDGQYGWPVIIDNTPQTHNDDTNKLYLQFVTDNNPNTVLYGQIARIGNAESNNFCGPDNLIQQVSEDGIVVVLTKILVLSNISVKEGSFNHNIASFNILVYHGTEFDYIFSQVSDDNGVQSNVISKFGNNVDFFNIINPKSLITVAVSSRVETVAYLKNQILNYNDGKQKGTSAVQTIVLQDSLKAANDVVIERVTYLSTTTDQLSNTTTPMGKITLTVPFYVTNGSFLPAESFQLSDPLYFDFSELNDDGDFINALIIKATDDTASNMAMVGITKLENSLITDLLMLDDSVRQPAFQFVRLSNEPIISAKGISYYKYLLALVVEDLSGNLLLIAPDENVVVYSMNNRVFFSSSYSEHMVKNEDVVKADFNFNI